MVFVAYATRPWVIYMHVQLPHYARRSQEILARFSRTLPPDTKLEITTMHFTGRPRINVLTAAELTPYTRSRLGIANLARLPITSPPRKLKAPPGRKRPWWQRSWWWRVIATRKPLTRFYVGPAAGRTKNNGVWENILTCIHKGTWGQKSAR